VDEEINFLAVHGLLHLRGWEDDTPDRRSRMLARQSEIIDAFHTARG
jgi:probable rRNA maturation factor